MMKINYFICKDDIILINKKQALEIQKFSI